MKNYFVLIAILFSLQPAFAGMNMKPGLWEIKTKMKSGAGERDPMQEMMAKMKPEQRKQMAAMMEKQGVGMGTNGIKICYTADMLKDAESLSKSQAKQSGCTTKITTQIDSKVAMEFTCKDGSKGTGAWNFHGNEKYDGAIVFTNPKGEKNEISHDGKFVSANCGNIKPILAH